MKKEIKNKNEIKKVLNKKLLIGAICFLLFIILTILVLTKTTNNIDSKVESLMISIRSDILTNIMTIITNIGSAYSLISITVLVTLIAIIKNKRLPINTIVNLISVFITSQIFKLLIRRPRPTGVFLVDATGYSYPSGHTMVSFAFFVFIAYSLSEKINNKMLKIMIKILTAILVITIGFSRIYLGVHHFTDILAGYLLGTSYLMIFLNIRNNIIKKEQKWK